MGTGRGGIRRGARGITMGWGLRGGTSEDMVNGGRFKLDTARWRMGWQGELGEDERTIKRVNGAATGAWW